MTEAEFLALPYRPCVGIMLINRDGLVWTGRRFMDGQVEHTAPGHEWQMPQGGIDADEDPFEAAKRELWEETNVRSATLLAEAPDWYTYDIPRSVVGARWKHKWRGQSQKWFAFRFDGDESEIDIQNPPAGEQEFAAWAWQRMERLPDMIIPFKRPVYEKVVAAFRHLGAA
ncbi:MAG: RNA pyrophosphohydrolase [Hyphomicrobiaceae bacterium]|nr:RNA pyrophosphohydrolase [Hyphomicrobiaceae bacterium]